jgi:hypothetical protein
MAQAVTPEAEGEVLLLWTGGWDSTFRLLWAASVEGRRVRPWYIAEQGRASTAAELAAMSAILERLGRSDPVAAARVQPLTVVPSGHISGHDDIRASFDRILGRAFIGSQYLWLADFCRQYALDGLELSVHRDDKAHALLDGIVVPGPPEDPRPTVSASRAGSDEHALFGAFRFPVFHLSKVDMQRLAREQGFDGLMELTWFCHAPRADGTPCGRCSPCVYTMEEGMARRLPWSSRVRYHTRVVARLRHWLMKHPALHARIRKLRGAGG